MTGPGGYVEEFTGAWKELDAVYLDLATAAWWPREIREWETGRREHERARRDTPPTREGFEAAARRWRDDAVRLRAEWERLRGATPEQRARWLDPWSRLRGQSPDGAHSEAYEHETSPMWPRWREHLWRRALEADLDLPRPLLPAELDEAEEQLGVRLPQEYRHFLLEVAAGVPGGLPAPNLAPLVRNAAGRWRWDNVGTRTDESRLSEPFPAREVDEPPENEPRRADFASEEAYRAELAAWENEEPPYDRDPVDDLTRGAVCLHALGCGDAIWLVVGGPSAGRMWADHFAHDAGLYALRTARRAPLTFRAWFLDTCPYDVAAPGARPAGPLAG